MNKIALAQAFNIDSIFPDKISLYLKKIGYNTADFFNIENSPIAIDATNHIQSDFNKYYFIFNTNENGYDNYGYMESSTTTKEGGDASVEYPVYFNQTGLHKLYLRVNFKENKTYKIKIYIDDELFSIGTFNVSSSSNHWTNNYWINNSWDDGYWISSSQESEFTEGWNWIDLNLNIYENKKQTMKIVVDTDNLLLNTLVISKNDISPNDYRNSIIYNYISLHFRIFETELLYPSNPIPIYSSIDSIEDIISDDWYNFSTEFYSSYTAINNAYCIVLNCSGTSLTNYILWDYSESDEYENLPSFLQIKQ